jgi:hypothetical protein
MRCFPTSPVEIGRNVAMISPELPLSPVPKPFANSATGSAPLQDHSPKPRSVGRNSGAVIRSRNGPGSNSKADSPSENRAEALPWRLPHRRTTWEDPGAVFRSENGPGSNSQAVSRSENGPGSASQTDSSSGNEPEIAPRPFLRRRTAGKQSKAVSPSENGLRTDPEPFPRQTVGLDLENGGVGSADESGRDARAPRRTLCPEAARCQA